MKYENQVIHGDCMEVLKDFPSESIEACVTDPPYGLNFMGKTWDDFKPREYQTFCVRWGKRVLRVLKPGAYLLAFSGTRTYHRLVCGLENAGFVIKDQIDWIYGSGFPKSQDISKAIDKHFGKEDEREKVGEYKHPDGKERNWETHKNARDSLYKMGMPEENKRDIEKPATPEAKKWNGWGTALKPAHEPIVLAQKPYEETYAENVLKHGVGGLNINDTRIELRGDTKRGGFGDAKIGYGDNEMGKSSEDYKARWKKEKRGRWPANLILDPEAVKMLDEQSGEREGCNPHRLVSHKKHEGWGSIQEKNGELVGYDDSGGASRFFYCAKAHKSERNAGLEDLETIKGGSLEGSRTKSKSRNINNSNQPPKVKNDIATLKPINLMRYLVRLVTPPDGTVLDPFAGSGTTGIACVIEGFNYILIEKRERFAKVIAPKRIEYWSKEEHWDELKDHNELPSKEELQNKKLTKCLQ